MKDETCRVSGFAAKWPLAALRRRGDLKDGLNIQHPISNIQQPTSNAGAVSSGKWRARPSDLRLPTSVLRPPSSAFLFALRSSLYALRCDLEAPMKTERDKLRAMSAVLASAAVISGATYEHP